MGEAKRRGTREDRMRQAAAATELELLKERQAQHALGMYLMGLKLREKQLLSVRDMRAAAKLALHEGQVKEEKE